MGISDSLQIRQQLHDAVNAGHILIPYHESDVTHIEPWEATNINYDPKGEPIADPPEGRVIGVQDIDVAIFAAITGYMGPKNEALDTAGSARIMQRVSRFDNRISTIYSIAALSYAGKLALHVNEITQAVPTLVYWAGRDQFKERPGLFPFVSLSSVAILGGVRVSSEELDVNPYELPAVEAIDWGAQASGFTEFAEKTQIKT